MNGAGPGDAATWAYQTARGGLSRITSTPEGPRRRPAAFALRRAGGIIRAGARSSAEEQAAHNRSVAGSNPAGPMPAPCGRIAPGSARAKPPCAQTDGGRRTAPPAHCVAA